MSPSLSARGKASLGREDAWPLAVREGQIPANSGHRVPTKLGWLKGWQ